MVDIGCIHNIPVFQSCPDCKREMAGSPLTSTFEFMSFPKPIKKPKKTMKDYAIASKKRNLARKGQRIKKRKK